ncbi:N-acetylmuramoyl-L-alanine amidase [Kitasatospora sp. NPDC059327]|uniref:peptidoglycan recognition protein family protein n=1 Tax=Kitasatospora sp. NPDC059327 TaxID=3346803 RepID=UPI0036AE7343
MATPLSADGFLNALRGEGLSVNEVGNWRTHNRNHKGQWGPVHGIVIHHTATTGTDASVQICRDGYAGLPGPLCHGVIDRDGGVHLVGYGRTNHAGAGDADAWCGAAGFRGLIVVAAVLAVGVVVLARVLDLGLFGPDDVCSGGGRPGAGGDVGHGLSE